MVYYEIMNELTLLSYPSNMFTITSHIIDDGFGLRPRSVNPELGRTLVCELSDLKDNYHGFKN